MARINLSEIVENLELELRPILKQAVEAAAPEAQVDAKALFREFRKVVNRRLDPWQRVPDRCVKPEY